MRATALIALLVAAGCGDDSTGSGDDLFRPRDGGARDLAVGGDQSMGGGDQSMGGDLAAAADLAMASPDLAGADLAGVDLAALDLAVATDLAARDLASGDLAARDAAAAADLSVGGADLGGLGDLGSVPLALVKGGVVLFGVTSDGYAVYGDLTTGALDAVAVAGGGQPIQLDANWTADQVLVQGKVVFFWQNVGNTSHVGTLMVWTAASGVKTAAAASIAYIAAARPDGLAITFTSNANNTGSTADLFGASADLTTSKKLVMGIDAGASGSNGCYPQLTFAATRAVAATCAPGVATATISTWDGTWTKTDLIQGAAPYYDTNDSGKLLALDGSNNLVSFPLAGGAGIIIAPNVGYQLLTSDGAAAVYSDFVASALWRSPTVTPQPLKLVPTGVTGVVKLSPDNAQVLLFNKYDNTTGGTDLYIASATQQGTATTLNPNTDSAPFLGFGDPFTADSSHVIYLTGINFMVGTGTLFTKPVGAGQATQQGTNAWVALAGLGSRVVFNDNYTAPANVEPRADLKIVDAAGGVATLLHAQADVDIYLTADKKQVVFADNVSANSAGLYAQTLP
jgi:hypothetical protein